MTWQAVETIPICIGASITRARAEAVRAALSTRVLPLARLVDGRAEPLATATLIAEGPALALLTAAHVFEHAAVGDLAVPLPCEAQWACLRSVRTRVIVHPDRDVALVMLDDRAMVRRLWSNWMPVPAAHLDQAASSEPAAGMYVVAGYPQTQARRVDGAVYMKPVVVFTRALDGERLAYARTARRVDGVDIHTPELDGVSGGIAWAIHEDDPGVDCLLRVAAMQVAFAHGRHLRTEPLRGTHLLFGRSR